MAYCNKCGAYIPDGQTKCLACGYDIAAAESAAQYAYSYNEESAKRDYEAERARKQEENRRWAQEEYARRQQEKREREAAARAAAQERSHSASDRSSAGFTYTEGNSRIFAELSYVFLGHCLQKMFLPDDEFAEYHAEQGKKLSKIGFISTVIGSLFGLGWIPFGFWVGFTVRGIKNAKDGKCEELYINSLFKK